MGNKLGRRRQVVDEKYTKPQGLYQHKNVDHKKLRKLILDSKLAPCFPGDDDCGGCDLEECPICFLYYPSLNRSRCCTKGICTECFLQMKTPNSTQPTQCPFCKTPNYAVEYRGVKSKAEKGLEQLEEQRVIEAKIRLRQQELQDDEDRMIKQKETNSSCSVRGLTEVDHCSTREPSFASAVESEEFIGLNESYANSAERLPPRSRPNREDGFDLDLEDIMVMEAIWLSIQEASRQCNPLYSDADAPRSAGNLVEEDCTSLVALADATAQSSASSSSPSGGLACAIAALAERQQTSNDTLNSYSGDDMSMHNIPGCSRYSDQEQDLANYIHASNGIGGCLVAVNGDGNDGEWVKHESNVAEVVTHNRNPDTALPSILRPQQSENQVCLQPGSNPIIPESFEEQMMLAKAVSLAEPRVRNGTTPEVPWH